MQRTFSKRVLGRVATDAHELTVLLHYSNAALLPRSAKFFLSVCEQAVLILAYTTFVVPAQAHLVRKALVSHVPWLATSIANHVGTIRVHEIGDDAGRSRYVHFSAHRGHFNEIPLFHVEIFFSTY